MQLWTDYEGLTIDGAYPLKRLLLPEGRSAFFSTANGKGEPLVLRLIECHFDQEEILARWRCLEALNHRALLRLERYGPIDLDGDPAVYAVLEKVDANLLDALDHGHLSVKETAQIAGCLLSALEMLHNHGFVHEHVEARNVFAVGDTVKLRSDCIREAREGEEGREAKRRDGHDAAVVLLQALTQRLNLDGVQEAEIPAPLGEMIRNGMNGRWGLAEMRRALEGSKLVANNLEAAAKPVSAMPVARKPVAAATAPTAEPGARAEAKREGSPQLRLEFSSARKERAAWDENPMRPGMRQQVFRRLQREGIALRSRWMAPAAAAAMLVVAGILFLHAWHSRTGTAKTVHPAARVAMTPPAPKRETGSLHAAKAAKPAAGKSGRTDWRVIAYTYSDQPAAQKMATKLAERHPELKPEVFTPRGHAPYLVAVGGVMDRKQAYALAHRARALGLPRDAYAQNY